MTGKRGKKLPISSKWISIVFYTWRMQWMQYFTTHRRLTHNTQDKFVWKITIKRGKMAWISSTSSTVTEVHVNWEPACTFGLAKVWLSGRSYLQIYFYTISNAGLHFIAEKTFNFTNLQPWNQLKLLIFLNFSALHLVKNFYFHAITMLFHRSGYITMYFSMYAYMFMFVYLFPSIDFTGHSTWIQMAYNVKLVTYIFSKMDTRSFHHLKCSWVTIQSIQLRKRVKQFSLWYISSESFFWILINNLNFNFKKKTVTIHFA